MATPAILPGQGGSEPRSGILECAAYFYPQCLARSCLLLKDYKHLVALLPASFLCPTPDQRWGTSVAFVAVWQCPTLLPEHRLSQFPC